MLTAECDEAKCDKAVSDKPVTAERDQKIHAAIKRAHPRSTIIRVCPLWENAWRVNVFHQVDATTNSGLVIMRQVLSHSYFIKEDIDKTLLSDPSVNLTGC